MWLLCSYYYWYCDIEINIINVINIIIILLILILCVLFILLLILIIILLIALIWLLILFILFIFETVWRHHPSLASLARPPRFAGLPRLLNWPGCRTLARLARRPRLPSPFSRQRFFMWTKCAYDIQSGEGTIQNAAQFAVLIRVLHPGRPQGGDATCKEKSPCWRSKSLPRTSTLVIHQVL